jgi:hypothetical protein
VVVDSLVDAADAAFADAAGDDGDNRVNPGR